MPHIDAGGAFLSVPGSRPDLFDKATASGARGVILDLEDAVAPSAKVAARQSVVEWIERADAVDVSIVVRVNPRGSEWFHDDVHALAAARGVSRSVMLPKTETIEELEAMDAVIDEAERESGHELTTVIALIESARGLRDVDALAAGSPRLVALSIGFADLSASLHRAARPDTSVWRPTRDRVLVAARAAGLAVLDGPHLETTVDELFLRDVEEAAILGFDAKWVIHPRQVAPVGDRFAPTEEAVATARRVIEALDDALSQGSGVATVDGLMIDEAVAIGARRVLASARITNRG